MAVEEMIQPIDDHVDQAQDRAVWQYKGKANWDALTEIHVERMQVLEDVLQQMLVDRSLRNSEGVQLDRFGADYSVTRLPGESDASYRQQIFIKINLLRSAGLVDDLVVNIQTIVNPRSVALQQVFPLLILITVFVDDFGEISTELAERVNETMQTLKAAGVGLEVGLQLNSSAFIVSDNPAGGNPGEGVATLLDGSDGGAFVKSLV